MNKTASDVSHPSLHLKYLAEERVKILKVYLNTCTG